MQRYTRQALAFVACAACLPRCGGQSSKSNAVDKLQHKTLAFVACAVYLPRYWTANERKERPLREDAVLFVIIHYSLHSPKLDIEPNFR